MTELHLPLVRRGKVRDMYAVGQDLLLMVASDRLSAFDVVLDEEVPGKGAILTRLSAFWFHKTQHIVPNHLVSEDVNTFPAGIRSEAERAKGRALLVRAAERISVECVVRGYLAGSGWAEYCEHGTLAGERLPVGLLEADRLPRPAFTPAIKADSGHDENISREHLSGLVGADLAAQLEQVSLALYTKAASHALSRGLILADTKFEFGFVGSTLTLIDEALTPDSSRYWDAAAYRPGDTPPSFDKQPLRDFLAASGWNKRPPPPALPKSVLEATALRYAEAERRLIGEPRTQP